MSKNELKIIETVKALYKRYQRLKVAVDAVDASKHQFVTDLDLFILATGIAEDIGLSQRSMVKWTQAWEVRLSRAEVYVEGKQIEYGIVVTPEPDNEPEAPPEPEVEAPPEVEATPEATPDPEPKVKSDPTVPRDSTSRNYADPSPT